MTAGTPAQAAPDRDCALCPRLREFRDQNRAEFGADWLNAPVPSFGTLDAPLLIVGLAPGLRGANRTGRPFTGDGAGDLLYPSLLQFGLAEGTYDRRADDGLSLKGVRITNAVRCVPPGNKPVGAEIAACNAFLAAEIAAMTRLRAVLALGRVAHEAVLLSQNMKKSAYKFEHSGFFDLPNGILLADSYHCSRYNLNTGRLTEGMFHGVLDAIKARL